MVLLLLNHSLVVQARKERRVVMSGTFLSESNQERELRRLRKKVEELEKERDRWRSFTPDPMRIWRPKRNVWLVGP